MNTRQIQTTQPHATQATCVTVNFSGWRQKEATELNTALYFVTYYLVITNLLLVATDESE